MCSNVTLSEMTPLERNVTDYRHENCIKFRYDLDKLPTLTVVIPFFNDALSMILRTVHSVLLKTPDKLLKEVRITDTELAFHSIQHTRQIVQLGI